MLFHFKFKPQIGFILEYIKNKYEAYFNMVIESYAPIVSGISPAEGPPGTIVKIRGENLGKDAKDVLSKSVILLKYIYIYNKWS